MMRLHHRPFLAIASLVLSFAASAAAAPTSAPPAQQPLGLVISGGVSEGAYQAGVTFAYMRYLAMRRDQPTTGAAAAAIAVSPHGDVANSGVAGAGIPDLAVVTGSSAGNINAFLAALTWCGPKWNAIKPRENLFWDSWINIGWDKLSPTEADQSHYRRRFRDTLSADPFAKDSAATAADVHSASNPHGVWDEDQPIYGSEDGLVTRRAFTAGYRYLATRLDDGGPYRPGCRVRIGLTATRAHPLDVNFAGGQARVQRFVFPMVAQSRGQSLLVQNLDDQPWLDAHREIGTIALLPADAATGKIQFEALVNLIKASSAFPVAFAPQWVEHRVVASGATSTPKATALHKERFVDGGLFDNQPFGLAYDLADAGATRNQGKDFEYLYVDTGPLRAPLPRVDQPAARNGLGLLWKTLGTLVSEGRRYENEGVARFHPDLRVQTNGRFFPVVGSTLVNSFGAFLAPSFRVHDYFVGVYDGIFRIAAAIDQLENPSRSEKAPPQRQTFKRVKTALVGEDADLGTFVERLYEYELSWTVPEQAAVAVELCQPPARGQGKAGAAFAEDGHVWTIFATLCAADQAARLLAESGEPLRASALRDASLSFEGIARALHRRDAQLFPAYEGWQYATLDRVVRRGIDVELADIRLRAPAQVRKVALTARMVLASALERDRDEVLDLDPSSVSRISGEHASLPSVFYHLLPYFLTWDFANSALMGGWEPKLRLPCGAYFPVGLYGVVAPYPQSGRTRLFSREVAFGVGWDPKKRLVDDVHLAGTMTGAWDWQRPDSFGLELAAHFFGSKMRVSVGLPQLFTTDDGRSRLKSTGRVDRASITLGLADVNGLLYWGGRSLWDWLRGGRQFENGEAPSIAAGAR
jgi:hypothetical protein